MTLRQTVEIPDNGRFWVEVPRDAPRGMANVIIQFPAKPARKRMTEAEEIEIINRIAERDKNEILENMEYQVDIFEAGDPGL